MTSADLIVATARGWIGTRFHHQGRLKKTLTHRGGVDCLGLLIGVAAELDIKDRTGHSLSNYDERHYSHMPDAAYLAAKLARVLDVVAHSDIRAGDIILLRIDDSPQHLAIVSNRQAGLGIIHAYAPARAVVEHAFDAWWLARIQAAFRIA